MNTPSATGIAAALLAASCCILPIALILSGLAGAGLMMTMMKYEWTTLPTGTIALLAAWVMHFRQKRRCESQACRYVGKRLSQAVLSVATLIVAAALLLRIFPSWTSSLIQTMMR